MLKLIAVGCALLVHVHASLDLYRTHDEESPKFLQNKPPKFKGETVNDRPIIGVLTQPIDGSAKKDPRYDNYTSYIMASYIRALESAGARTVPLIFDGDLETELAKLDHINGVFYCGGSAGGDYDVFGKKVFERAREINDKGKFLPVWGTCLGFENLAMYVSDAGEDCLDRFNSNDESYALEFLVEPKHTKMFASLGKDAKVFAKMNITYNHHSWGVSPDRFSFDEGLAAVFTPTAVSHDNDGKAFVAAMEAKQYPFFATQFHPEKAQFIFYPGPKIDHSMESIHYNRYFADFFVEQCRMNDSKFASYEEEVSHLTDNYATVNTAGYDGVDYVF